MRKGTAISPDMKKFYELGKKEEPVKEIKEAEPVRAGCCFKCGYGSWTMKSVKSQIIRTCKRCGTEQPPID